jgi:ATP-dependent DNA helicase RecQ
MHSSLHHYFGFSSFRPGQEEAIQSLLAGQHTLTVMPTGSGKSLIFQLAALHLPGLTLVISPLIALMKDQVDSLVRRNIAATCINSSLPPGEQSQRMAKMAAGKYRLVYIAPERLRNTTFLNALRKQTISLLAVDEAHCISEWGHDFRPDYLQIGPARARLENPLTVALTATATPQVQADIIRLLNLPASTKSIVTGFNRPNLLLNVCYSTDLESKYRALQECIRSQTGKGAAIVYAGTRRDTEETAAFLSEAFQVKAEYYHAGLPAEQRSRVQDAFLSGKTDIICATNAFGMGVDRADVRQVIHFNLPGSLEAYYQEAGRAGRDGEPARATLLYQPQDRALQEFFIKQNRLTPPVLSTLYKAFQNGVEAWVSLDELSRLTALHPVQIRVGLAELVRGGALVHLGDEGFSMLYRRGKLDMVEIGKSIERNDLHLQSRRVQLDGIVAYAEANRCRRVIILKHFGDAGPPEAPECCDNCQDLKREQPASGDLNDMSYAERAGLVVLDSLRRLKSRIGKVKLAQILKGSKSQEILSQKYDRFIYYARLEVLTLKEIENVVEQLVGMGYAKSIGGDYPVLTLTPKGEAALVNKSVLAIKLAKNVQPEVVQRKKAERAAGSTYEYTAQLFSKGLNVEQIAIERQLTLMTIYGHFARLISAGRCTAREIIPEEIVGRIEEAITQAGSVDALFPIQALLGEEVDYNLIRCVVEDWKRSHPVDLQAVPVPVAMQAPARKTMPDAARVITLGNSRSDDALPELILALNSKEINVRRLAGSALGKIGNPCAVGPLLDLLAHEDKPQVRQYAIKALAKIRHPSARPVLEKISLDMNEVSYNRSAARNALMELHQDPREMTNGEPGDNISGARDSVAAFLSKNHPRPLNGPWQCGWALDFHSRFSGGEWSRSTVGDLTFRLKYNGEQSVVEALVEKTCDLLKTQPALAQVDFILPVPPSAQREVDPVGTFCTALGEKVHLPVRSLLVKTRQTQPQKELKTLAQKRTNVSGAFAQSENVKGQRILLVDDLFDSGATLEEITRLLIRQGAAHISVFTLTRTIHADA